MGLCEAKKFSSSNKLDVGGWVDQGTTLIITKNLIDIFVLRDFSPVEILQQLDF